MSPPPDDRELTKQASATARISANFLAAIVESSDDAIISKDIYGIITSWNKGAEAIFGYTANEMLGTSILRLIPPDRQDEENYILGKIRRGEKVDHFETLRQTKDGRLINVSVTTSPIKDDHGSIIGASKTARDITTQKLHEQEIIRLSRIYYALSQINQAIVWTRNREELFGKICHALVDFGKFNMAWIGQYDEKTLQVRPVAHCGSNTDVLLRAPTDDDNTPEGHGLTDVAIREETKQVINDLSEEARHPQWREWAIEAGFHAAAAFPILHGGKLWGSLTVYSEEKDFFKAKEIALLEEAAGDVSFALDNFSQQHDLRESEERYKALFERSLDCVFLCDFEGRFLDANQAALDLTGYGREELSSLTFASLLSEDQLALAFKVTEEIQTFGHQKLPTEFRLRCKDGGEVHVETRSTLIYRNGHPFAIQGIARDLTERKRAEAKSVASEQCINAFFTSAPAGMVLLDERLRYIRINETVAKINGVPIEDHLGKTVREVIPKLAPMVEPLLQKVLATGEPMLNIEISGETSSQPGVMRHWLESFFPIFGMNASPEGVGVIFVEITERKRAEETLQRLRDQSDAILNSVSEGVHGIGLDGRIIFENPSSAAMLGYEIAELIGKPAHSTMHHTRSNGTAYPQSECPIYTALKEGLVQHVTDEVFWRKDGTSFPVEYTSTPLRDKDGVIIGTTVVFNDITERKRSQEELRQSEHRFREMLENLNLIAIMVDTQCHLTFCNNHLLRLTGWKHEEVIGCDWIEKFIPRSDATTREVFFSNIHTGKIPVHYENAIKTKNGEERLIAWNNTVLRDAEGNVSGVAAVGEDVTESRRAAERIAEQAALLDKTQDAIVVCNLEGGILFWSKGAERLYGFTGEEALGQKSGELIYDGNTRKYDEAFAATLADGEWTGELQQSTKDGRKLNVESRWTLVRDAQGNRKSILAINTDVTERKKIEAQFLRAQRMESIGTLAGGVAHDLNNILAPIMMSIEILRDVRDETEKKDILETIEASAQRGSDIVRQILSFARGMEGKRIEVQPKHLLKEMEHIVRNTFPKNIRLEAAFPPDPWTIIGDPTQIHQILLNLCVNARDAMPEGGTLVIGVENCAIDAHYAAMNPDAKVGDYVCLSVADTGTGMPPSVIDKIFDPFFTTKEMGLGTGLGLSTVLTIVKSHDGFLKVDSEPGKGTTFRIYLPAAPTGGESAGEAKQAVLPRGHGETVLIVDDEGSILTITSQTLQAFGYEVLTANNGAEAVANYAQHRDKIAVVLTDMMMPVMDGRATIHALRQINPAVKIIAASGLNAKADVSTASDAGVKAFLSKPYSAERLLKALRAVLDEA